MKLLRWILSIPFFLAGIFLWTIDAVSIFTGQTPPDIDVFSLFGVVGLIAVAGYLLWMIGWAISPYPKN